MANETKNQGEGDRESARRYNEAVQDTTRKHPPQERIPERLSENEEEDLRRAEEAGKSRSKGEDPQISHGTKIKK